MTSHAPIHARNHRSGGVDPLPPLPRARVWSTYATPPFTIAGAATAHMYVFNHGASTDTDTFAIQYSAETTPPSVRIRILRGGVYAITYRFVADDNSADDWEGTVLNVEVFDIAPDYSDPFWARLWHDAFGVANTYVTTIQNDPDWTPTWVAAELSVPDGFPALTFGRADYLSEHPERNTPCYIEAVRLGDAYTQDWTDWWSNTPADAAIPET